MRRRWQTLATAAFAMTGSISSLTFPRVARADDRSDALAVLASLDLTSAEAAASNPETKKPGTASPLAPANGPTNDAVTRARDALERGTRMRTAGDLAHARLAEGLGLEWAEMARDLARTAAMEAKARAAEVQAIEAAARVERDRALLEEAIARTGRLRAELLAATKKESARTTKERTSVAATTEPATKPKPAPKQPTGDDKDADAPTMKPAPGRTPGNPGRPQ